MTLCSWIRQPFARPAARPVKAPARPRLRLEALEGRTVPAVLTVNSVLDNVTPDGVLTMCEAL